MFLQKSRAKQQNLAATIIQASWRGHAVRIRLRCEREAQFQALQHKAATLIQVGDFCIYFSKYLQNGDCLCWKFNCFLLMFAGPVENVLGFQSLPSAQVPHYHSAVTVANEKGIICVWETLLGSRSRPDTLASSGPGQKRPGILLLSESFSGETAKRIQKMET